MQPLKKILPKIIKKAGISRQVEASMVTEVFSAVVEEILGKKVSKKVKAMHLKDKVLTVACLSSVLAQEIQLNQKKIINKLNKKFDKQVVDKLRFLS